MRPNNANEGRGEGATETAVTLRAIAYQNGDYSKLFLGERHSSGRRPIGTGRHNVKLLGGRNAPNHSRPFFSLDRPFCPSLPTKAPYFRQPAAIPLVYAIVLCHSPFPAILPFMLFFVGTSPRDAYMLPCGTHIMVNARQYWNKKGNGRLWLPWGRTSRGGLVFLDCGGYVFFKDLGQFPFTVEQYMELVVYLRPTYYASTDYPCEPSITAKLGDMSVLERIERTVENCRQLAQLDGAAPKSTMVPVIQGWVLEDYKHCLDLYRAAGLLRPYVAVGSMCTRSNTREIAELFKGISDYARSMGVARLHAFGLKRSPYLAEINNTIYSRDSAVAYFANNRQTRREMDGRRFPRGRDEKRRLAKEFLDGLTAKGFTWNIGCCPECESLDVSQPSEEFPFFTCVDCGHSWGQVEGI